MALEGGPAHNAKAVTPNDTTILGCRSVFIGTGGNVQIDTPDGTTDVVFKNVPSGTLLPVAALRVKAATTATDIVALY